MAENYTYGQGLSNEGAAYNLWGSAPGTNPYYTPASNLPFERNVLQHTNPAVVQPAIAPATASPVVNDAQPPSDLLIPDDYSGGGYGLGGTVMGGILSDAIGYQDPSNVLVEDIPIVQTPASVPDETLPWQEEEAQAVEQFPSLDVPFESDLPDVSGTIASPPGLDLNTPMNFSGTVSTPSPASVVPPVVESILATPAVQVPPITAPVSYPNTPPPSVFTPAPIEPAPVQPSSGSWTVTPKDPKTGLPIGEPFVVGGSTPAPVSYPNTPPPSVFNPAPAPDEDFHVDNLFGGWTVQDLFN